jgi:hypothetical protein
LSIANEERRACLYRQVGEALHLAQTPELQIAMIVSIVNGHLNIEIDAGGLIVPDYRKTFGQLMHQLRSLGTIDARGEQVLEEALQKRNYVVHDFFNKNIYAFSEDEVFQHTRKTMESDSKAIALGVAVTQGWLLALCRAYNIDAKKLLFRQGIDQVFF